MSAVEKDAWQQLDELAERFTEEHVIVTADACDRSVKLDLIEFDFTKDRFDPRHKQHHSTRRNVRTMRELALALLKACEFVEESNPEWAARTQAIAGQAPC